MWMLYAVGSALFAGVTAILAKAGVRHTGSNVATAIRTVVVLFFSWLMVFVVGSQSSLRTVSGTTLLFLVLSGLATGASWLCYFRALQVGDVNKVVPVDKASIVLTVLLAIGFLGETDHLLPKLAGIAGIGVGTFLMIQKRDDGPPVRRGRSWLLWASLSAVFAALTAILGKIGITDVESNLGTAIRTIVVGLMAWLVVLVSGERHELTRTPRRDLLFICLSGVATGASWLCYYRALQEGPASLVVPIDKLSILVTVVVSRLAFGEQLSRRAGLGLALIVVGTLVMLA